MQKLRQRINYLLSINYYKTVYINFKYFKWVGVKFFPIIVFRGVCLNKTGGKILLNKPLRSRMVLIGTEGVGTIDYKNERTEWQVEGTIIINGQVSFGKGSRISVGSKGRLVLGSNFNISGRSSIICEREIIFGNNVLLSWDILILDSDFHYIYDKEGKIINQPQAIVIGNHVWIGCRCTILKGARIPNDAIIAAGSIISSHKMGETSAIYGGSGRHLELIKKYVRWSTVADS